MNNKDLTKESVNHPSHYNDGNIEVIDYIEDKNLGFHLGNAIKYISRAGKKDESKTIEDLEKAIWYIQRYISLIKRRQPRKKIVDLWPEWHEETGEIHFVVEVGPDTSVTIASLVPESRPSFADATSFEELDISDYGEWYDMALEEAHRQNYFLEGELQYGKICSNKNRTDL